MKEIINVAVLGATGYVGLELIKILIKHPYVKINFLGSEKYSNLEVNLLDSSINNNKIPKFDLNKNFNPQMSDLVFLALPHGVSNEYVKKFYDNIKIIDLSADFRFDSIDIYSNNYKISHSCPNLLKEFVYGLPEFNNKLIINKSNIAVPGCYPTSILLPLLPIVSKNLIKTDNIIIDSKSGYSGAGKNYNLANIQDSSDPMKLNFYNYNTNNHRHMPEIQQELNKFSKKNINFTFNPHILPIARGMMSTIYCNLENNITIKDIKNTLLNFYKNSYFVHLIDNDTRADFFSIQNTNNCLIKLFNHHKTNKIVIVSLIDNLLKGSAGQAIQCFNIINNFEEALSLE